MVNTSCAKCSAAIIPGTNFCRACGAPIESTTEPSEMQTALLDEKVPSPTTQRLEPRTTTETDDAVALRTYHPASPAVSHSQAPASKRGLIIVVLVLILLLAGGGLIGLKRALEGPNKIQVSQRYTYPGSHTVVNIGDAGGAVLQMETTDRLDKVSEWYVTTFKPSKVMRVPPATTIIRDDKVTVTLVGTDQGTSIVIKQSGP